MNWLPNTWMNPVIRRQPVGYGMAILLLLLSCNSGKKYHDDEDSDADVPDSYGDTRRFQSELDRFYRVSANSPLTPEQKKEFEGLRFYPIDTTWEVEAAWEQIPDALPVMLETNTSEIPPESGGQRPYLLLHFEREGQQFELTAYQLLDPMGFPEADTPLFLPFGDETNGISTYDGGRYLDIPYPEPGATYLSIDFNRAYHPYCAYNPKYVCPLVPTENVLSGPVRAGVRF